jgi:exodeoxyribonuclease VII small subunit
MAKEKPIEELTYEKSLEELDNVLDSLEQGDRDLEETLVLYERGKQLLGHCRDLLDQAQLRVSELTFDGELNPMEDDS